MGLIKWKRKTYKRDTLGYTPLTSRQELKVSKWVARHDIKSYAIKGKRAVGTDWKGKTRKLKIR